MSAKKSRRLPDARAGTTLIDLVMSMAIVTLLLGGVYLVYFSIQTGISNVGVRSAATAAINQEIEVIRNLPYASVGTVGGIPSGVVPQVQDVSVDNVSFSLQTTILNLNDPYDASPSSSPVADYKMVSITARCPICANFAPIEITTTVAPSFLAQGSVYGSIFINAIDATNGNPVPGASIRILNTAVTPTIDLTATANASGVLKLIGVPTSSQGYQIFATKPGYSSAQTYPLGGAGNPNPLQPNINVASQTVSSVTFIIDRVSTLTVQATDNRCTMIPNEQFSVQGSTLIGTNPNVVKYATSSTTGVGGAVILPNMEGGTYALVLNDATKDMVGTIPLSPMIINPSSTQIFQFILQPSANPSLLVTVADEANGMGIPDANVSLSKPGVSLNKVTNHAAVSQNDWSGGKFASQSGGISASVPGTLTLLANASSGYDTGTVSWLISDTFDLGGASGTLNAITWSPSAEPAGTLLAFQLAVNNDNATWNFLGPDGTPSSYFVASSSIPASFSGNRYFRYEAFMSTQDSTKTPTFHSISFDFSGNCVPGAQALFTSLPQGSYAVAVTALNYGVATATVAVGSGFQSSTILLTHL